MGLIHGANGDMGENNTAALDPIFFFHHCFVDHVFWLWQRRHGSEKQIDIIDHYKGTNSSDAAIVPGVKPGELLGLSTPLYPFMKNSWGDMYTSKDMVNIHDLGYDYAPCSLESVPLERDVDALGKFLTVRGVNRSMFEGSFIMKAYAVLADGGERYIGAHTVLSRYRLERCANCLTHLEVVAHYPLSGLGDVEINEAQFWVKFVHRGDALPSGVEFTCAVNGAPVPVWRDWRTKQMSAAGGPLPHLFQPGPRQCCSTKNNPKTQRKQRPEHNVDSNVDARCHCVVS